MHRANGELLPRTPHSRAPVPRGCSCGATRSRAFGRLVRGLHFEAGTSPFLCHKSPSKRYSPFQICEALRTAVSGRVKSRRHWRQRTSTLSVHLKRTGCSMVNGSGFFSWATRIRSGLLGSSALVRFSYWSRSHTETHPCCPTIVHGTGSSRQVCRVEGGCGTMTREKGPPGSTESPSSRLRMYVLAILVKYVMQNVESSSVVAGLIVRSCGVWEAWSAEASHNESCTGRGRFLLIWGCDSGGYDRATTATDCRAAQGVQARVTLGTGLCLTGGRRGKGGSGTQKFVYQKNGPPRFALLCISFFPMMVTLVWRGVGVQRGGGGVTLHGDKKN